METKLKREHLPANEHELNQLCKKALKQVGEIPDRESLYWPQLIFWALESGEVILDDSPSQYRIVPFMDFLTFLSCTDQAKPDEVMKFLVFENYAPKEERPEWWDNPNQECLVVDYEKDCDPVDLAAKIIDYLDSRMSAVIPNYPRANPIQ